MLIKICIITNSVLAKELGTGRYRQLHKSACKFSHTNIFPLTLVLKNNISSSVFLNFQVVRPILVETCLLHSFKVVKDLAIVAGVLGLTSRSVATASAFLRSYVAQTLSSRDASRHYVYSNTLQRNNGEYNKDLILMLKIYLRYRQLSLKFSGIFFAVAFGFGCRHCLLSRK